LCLALGVSPIKAHAELQKLVDVLGPDAFYYMLHYVADGAGYFKDEGIEVELVTVNSGSRQAATVLGGSAEANECNFSVNVQGAAQGGELVNIADIYKVFAHVLFLSNDAIKRTGISADQPFGEQVKRLHGLKIGITSAGSGTDQLMRSIFIGQGLDPDKEVQLLPLGGGPPMMAALTQHAIDGFVFTPPLPQAAEAQGLGHTVMSPYLGQIPELRGLTYMALGTSKDTLKNKRPQLLALLKALAKARKLISDDPATASKYTRKHFMDMDQKVYDAAFTEAVKGLPDHLSIGKPELDETLANMKLLDKDANINVKFADVVDSSLAQQADKEILGK
jgi:NitT/TauT family transport system substrate-binding protein